jgi:hypothetical protein
MSENQTYGGPMRRKYYSPEDAMKHAREYVRTHPSWVLICDIENHDVLYVQWEELDKKSKAYWKSEEFYDENARKICKVANMHMSGAGELYADICDVPVGHNSMLMFKVGTKGKLRDMVKRAHLFSAL